VPKVDVGLLTKPAWLDLRPGRTLRSSPDGGPVVTAADRRSWGDDAGVAARTQVRFGWRAHRVPPRPYPASFLVLPARVVASRVRCRWDRCRSRPTTWSTHQAPAPQLREHISRVATRVALDQHGASAVRDDEARLPVAPAGTVRVHGAAREPSPGKPLRLPPRERYGDLACAVGAQQWFSNTHDRITPLSTRHRTFTPMAIDGQRHR
jgi:hypothetical protein